MIIDRRADFYNLQLEDQDFKAMKWREFCDALRGIPGTEYRHSIKTWFIPVDREKDLVLAVQEFSRDPRQMDMFL